MTRSPVEVKDSTMIGGILQILNIHYGSPIDEYILLWCMIVSRFVSSFIWRLVYLKFLLLISSSSGVS